MRTPQISRGLFVLGAGAASLSACSSGRSLTPGIAGMSSNNARKASRALNRYVASKNGSVVLIDTTTGSSILSYKRDATSGALLLSNGHASVPIGVPESRNLKKDTLHDLGHGHQFRYSRANHAFESLDASGKVYFSQQICANNSLKITGPGLGAVYLKNIFSDPAAAQRVVNGDRRARQQIDEGNPPDPENDYGGDLDQQQASVGWTDDVDDVGNDDNDDDVAISSVVSANLWDCVFAEMAGIGAMLAATAAGRAILGLIAAGEAVPIWDIIETAGLTLIGIAAIGAYINDCSSNVG